jgi:hypothetical protein
MLEQKVQFDQAMYLAKDFEEKKLEIEDLECDLEELTTSKRDSIKRRKISINIKFKQYELKQLQIAMGYRMDEVRGWQAIQEKLLQQMREIGISEQQIWSKEEGEFANMFFLALNNYMSIENTTDSAERGNLTSLVLYVVNKAMQSGRLESLMEKCNEAQKTVLRSILGP